MPIPRLTRAGRATLGALCLAVVGSAGIGIVNAASAPPAPTITSGPPTPTASSTATFAFTAGQAAVQFRCSLDSASYGACSGPRTYRGLGDGSHRFRVEYQAPAGAISSVATATWMVDTRAPVSTIGFPADGHVYAAAGYAAGCASTGICGTAADGAGVAAIGVSIRQAANTEYWNGTSFGSPAEVFNPATLGTPGGTSTTWRYPLSLPGDGSYSVRVRADDVLGNTTRSGSHARATFAIDTVPPPAPSLTGGPGSSLFSTSADFHATDAEHGVTFRCALDRGSLLPCRGEHGAADYDKLAPGDHVFRVVAVDHAGNLSSATTFTWTVLVRGAFPISGSLSAPLSPGLTVPLNLSLRNPNNFALKVLTVSIAVEHTTTTNGVVNPGCDGPANLLVSQGFSGSVTIPANSTRSLQELGMPPSHWPQITMPDLPVNQDACKGTTFTFDYTGTATS